jgi:hypothetical protein
MLVDEVVELELDEGEVEEDDDDDDEDEATMEDEMTEELELMKEVELEEAIDIAELDSVSKAEAVVSIAVTDVGVARVSSTSEAAVAEASEQERGVDAKLASAAGADERSNAARDQGRGSSPRGSGRGAQVVKEIEVPQDSVCPIYI